MHARGRKITAQGNNSHSHTQLSLVDRIVVRDATSTRYIHDIRELFFRNQADLPFPSMPTSVKLPNSELARLANKPPWYRSLFVQLIAAIVIGVLIG